MLAFRFLNKYFIIVDPIVKKSPKKSLKAFAHKLAHLENFRKKSYIRLIIYFLRYYSNKKFRKKEERNTDRITILKGYGRELLIYREFIKRVIKKDKRIYNNYKRISKNYLSEKEIEGYLKKRYKTKKSLTIKINSWNFNSQDLFFVLFV